MYILVVSDFRNSILANSVSARYSFRPILCWRAVKQQSWHAAFLRDLNNISLLQINLSVTDWKPIDNCNLSICCDWRHQLLNNNTTINNQSINQSINQSVSHSQSQAMLSHIQIYGIVKFCSLGEPRRCTGRTSYRPVRWFLSQKFSNQLRYGVAFSLAVTFTGCNRSIYQPTW